MNVNGAVSGHHLNLLPWPLQMNEDRIYGQQGTKEEERVPGQKQPTASDEKIVVGSFSRLVEREEEHRPNGKDDGADAVDRGTQHVGPDKKSLEQELRMDIE